MRILVQANHIIGIVFMICYFYQIVYLGVGLLKKAKKPTLQDPKQHRYAVLVAARNEEGVIGALVESVVAQSYPQELLDIYVVADNCTDQTAQVAARAGATVYSRQNTEQVGKGYALEFLIQRIWKSGKAYDGYFVFDADNLLDRNYISEMNRNFAAGDRLVTGYRNSKNYADNWISAGYSLWFLRESRFLNQPRACLNTSCAISGTGFLVHHDILKKNGGWAHFLLTEDIEFTVDSILKGEKIGYCSTAVLYDEQPTLFSQSWRQRMRWARGYLQVFQSYGTALVATLFKKRSFACMDMIMTIMPAIVLTMMTLIINGIALIAALRLDADFVLPLIGSMFGAALNAYGFLFAIGLITGLAEWKNIHASPGQKILSFLTFPLFMLTYIPISFCALFMPVQWKPITHSKTVRITDIEKERRAA